MIERLLTRKQVEEQTGLSRSSIYARMRTGTFPQARRVPGEFSVWWLESEVDAWIAKRVEESVPAIGRKSA